MKAFAMFRDVMPPERDEEEGSAVADLLELLCTGYPGLREALFTAEEQIRDFVNMLKNGRNIHFCGELQTPLCGGDTVALFLPASG